ncbi:MAG: hypothetical protein AAFN40_00590 [Cyanobacteria bacterium J06560_6]
MSSKRPLYADQPEQLQSKGLSRKKATMLIAQKTTIALNQEWLEAFWCSECYETQWYHVQRNDEGQYIASLAERELWQRAQGVIPSHGNPSVGEFSRKQACMSQYHLMQQSQYGS